MNIANWFSQNKVVVVFAFGLLAGIMYMSYIDKKQDKQSSFCC